MTLNDTLTLRVYFFIIWVPLPSAEAQSARLGGLDQRPTLGTASIQNMFYVSPTLVCVFRHPKHLSLHLVWLLWLLWAN